MTMLNIQSEANRCLQCKIPRCRTGCPISTPIPQAIALFKLGKLQEAAQMLFDNNPLSLVCAIVCDHDKQCEGHCVKGIKESPVEWGSIERFISDTYLERVQIEKAPSTGKSVAVIGSGPAGMSAAIELIRRGHEVTVFEAQSEIGGMLRYGIPEFRLPKSILDRYAKKMKAAGIRFRLHTAVGSSITIEDMLRDGYQAVLISSGLWRAQALRVPGETLPNVCYGIHYLASPKSFEIGNRLAVIGTGNTAIDVARTALHQGVSYVTLYARRAQSMRTPKKGNWLCWKAPSLKVKCKFHALQRTARCLRRSGLTNKDKLWKSRKRNNWNRQISRLSRPVRDHLRCCHSGKAIDYKNRLVSIGSLPESKSLRWKRFASVIGSDDTERMNSMIFDFDIKGCSLHFAD